ncbi:TetR family transcriptional regulator [Conexibacter sp. W3-3-2]|uniref:TetR/AcrR family transcriptional regulator n=1 Tax=Conexibacter sp. W3-3-2 TaxID=2675227 RepID=UPI0012B718A7|nr:TetR/AcrR family transcriptional regulator [Conexibacter sp. W3-3-2]MTD47430.1 TetR family transcriptional regulator [Conexibacter sp. W3-3-2]MTD47569.1 TetR family transcriptional regulator [Conexibacter sp. W3-3-2]
MKLSDEQLDAAAAAMGRTGYAGLRLEDLASAIGVSRVTLHRHEIGKGDVLGLLAARATTEYRDAMWPLLTSSLPAGERLSAAVDVLLEQAERHLPLLVALGAISDEVFHEADDDPEGDVTRGVFTEPLERLLHDARAEAVLRPEQDPDLATVLFNSAGWTYIHLRTGHRWSPERAAAAVRALVLHGILQQEPTRPER